MRPQGISAVVWIATYRLMAGPSPVQLRESTFAIPGRRPGNAIACHVETFLECACGLLEGPWIAGAISIETSVMAGLTLIGRFLPLRGHAASVPIDCTAKYQSASFACRSGNVRNLRHRPIRSAGLAEGQSEKRRSGPARKAQWEFQQAWQEMTGYCRLRHIAAIR